MHDEKHKVVTPSGSTIEGTPAGDVGRSPGRWYYFPEPAADPTAHEWSFLKGDDTKDEKEPT